MNGIVLFLLKSVVVSAILTSWYWLGLRNKRLHQYNRFFLLFTLCASVVIPLLHFQWFAIREQASGHVSPSSFLLQVSGGHSFNEQQTEGHLNRQGINW